MAEEKLTRAQRRFLFSLNNDWRALAPGSEKAMARRLGERGLVALASIESGGSPYDQRLDAKITDSGRAALGAEEEAG